MRTSLKSTLIFFFSLAVLGLELRAYILSHPPASFFVMGFYQDRFDKNLFPQAGFKLQSSRSMPPE
jgi:hypothetical protein